MADAGLDSLRHLPELQTWRLSTRSHWTRDGSALAIFQSTDYESSPTGQGFAVWLVPRTVVEVVFHRALSENQFLIPGYVTTAATVAGWELPRPGTPAVLDEKWLLGGAHQASETMWTCPVPKRGEWMTQTPWFDVWD